MEVIQGLRPGAMLRHDSYRIERILGQGGFGITYLATDLTLDRKVAVKEFFPKDYCDRDMDTSHVTLGTTSTGVFVEKLKAKFLKEARNIAKFDNPGIIKIFAAFEENNTAYYIMEYIEGTSLGEIVKREGPMSPEWALYFTEKVGAALDFVHSNHMNHLDVKPANIMVRSADNEPVLIDFGLSKQYDSEGHQTSTTPTGISPGFAPIEQYNHGGVSEFSPQTDLYSLAATLYYMLSGTVPPQAIKLLDEPLPMPSSVPANLVEPIRKAMSPVRTNRYESVREFLDAIKSGTGQADIPVVEPVNTTFANTGYEITAEDDSLNKSKKVRKWVIGSAVVLALVFCVILLLGRGDDEPVQIEQEPVVEVVTDMYWESPLGTSSYTGEVIEDASGKKLPDGKGKAKISGGKFDGSVYDGNFVEGRMEGPTKYVMKNGDTFEGTFLNNEYEKGKYTIKATGEYFEGTFKNGGPSEGDWYNKDGEKSK